MSIRSEAFERWLAGLGPIVHREETVARAREQLARLLAAGRIGDEDSAYALLAAADRLTCMALNVVAHMTYARRIDLSGRALGAEDFKPTPEGHADGSFNMVPAFIGDLLANALSGTTRIDRAQQRALGGQGAAADLRTNLSLTDDITQSSE